MKNNLQNIQQDYSREDRFKRIAANRTNEVLDRIRILGNCSNKSTYKYSEDEVNKIFRALDQEIKNCKAKFTNKKAKFKWNQKTNNKKIINGKTLRQLNQATNRNWSYRDNSIHTCESEFSYLRDGQWQRARYPEDCDNHSIEELKLLFKGIVLCEKHFEWVVGSVTNTAWVLRNIEERLDSDSDCDETKAYFETKELYDS